MTTKTIALLALCASCADVVLDGTDAASFPTAHYYDKCVTWCEESSPCEVPGSAPCSDTCRAEVELAVGTACTVQYEAEFNCIDALPICTAEPEGACSAERNGWLNCLSAYCGSTYPAEPAACNLGQPCSLVPCPMGQVCTSSGICLDGAGGGGG